jgi:hypothetical protein
MYDDFNELFWDVERVKKLLPLSGTPEQREHGGRRTAHASCSPLAPPSTTGTPEQRATGAYLHFRELLCAAEKREGGATVALREHFCKTYREKVGWFHAYFAYVT